MGRVITKSELDLSPIAAISSVGASATVVTLKGANPNRKTLTIVNDGNSSLKIKYGSDASSTSFTHELGSNDEVIIDDYSGIVTGIWQNANGDARITEVSK